MVYALDENGMRDAAEAVKAYFLPDNISDELRELMRCVEWWKSGDYGFDQVKEAYDAWVTAL